MPPFLILPNKKVPTTELIDALASQPQVLADMLEQLGLRLTMGAQEQVGADLRGVARDLRLGMWG